MPLPNVIIIGGMKCGTSALHRYLDDHPDIAMAPGKELNFFFDAGTWHRGTEWYAEQFPPGTAVRGEASPGYTSPSHAESATRMASVVPEARLVYLVRDPLTRAVSQYRHHRREGDETRPVDEALLDPDSQYVARSRYFARLAPFLEHFSAEQVAVVATEDLHDDRRAVMSRIYGFVGADPGHWSQVLDSEWHVGDDARCDVGPELREAFGDLVRDDVDRLHAFCHDNALGGQ